MKFWSEVECRWIEGDVMWSGKGAMAHELRDREYWQQKHGDRLMNAAPDRASYPSRKEIKKANLVPCDEQWPKPKPAAPPARRCACGRALTTSAARERIKRCPICAGKKRNMRKVA
jgi:hypothetical protein